MSEKRNGRPSIEELRQHVTDLLDRHEIIYRQSSRGAWALLEAWEVQFPPIKSDISYGAAMHEIGHLSLAVFRPVPVQWYESEGHGAGLRVTPLSGRREWRST
jgi:hypothetical protein